MTLSEFEMRLRSHVGPVYLQGRLTYAPVLFHEDALNCVRFAVKNAATYGTPFRVVFTATEPSVLWLDATAPQAEEVLP